MPARLGGSGREPGYIAKNISVGLLKRDLPFLLLLILDIQCAPSPLRHKMRFEKGGFSLRSTRFALDSTLTAVASSRAQVTCGCTMLQACGLQASDSLTAPGSGTRSWGRHRWLQQPRTREDRLAPGIRAPTSIAGPLDCAACFGVA